MTTPDDEPLSDYDLARVKGYGTRYGLKLTQSEAYGLFARLAKAEAESDAAVAFRNVVIGELLNCHIYTPEHETNAGKALHKAIMWNQTVALDPRVSEDARNLVAEGERRATAAIVAWLRAVDWCSESRSYAEAFADAIERGDHITEGKP